ncbi:MAG TPA: hypothetical protein VLG36_00445 [Candidatus Chromulinivoraceae bacterium]|nr:hypothetical protein [Candidatus Chromulinivoraceae bacterium]
MKIKQTIVGSIVALGMIVGIGGVISRSAAAATCGGATTSIISCSQGASKSSNAQDTGVWGLLVFILKILTAGVGIAAVGGIVYASILYASSSDSAEQTKKAKDIIRNVAIGVIAYASMYLLLNFLVPGGVFQ